MLNRATIIGRITKDLEMRYTTSGKAVVQFTLACQRNGKDAPTDFIGCVSWGQSAAYLKDYADKGALISVSGRIQTRNYEGSDGKKVYVTELNADEVQILANPRKENVTVAEPEYETEDMNLGIVSDDLPF